MTWTELTAHIRRMWAVWIPYWQNLTGNCQCEFCTIERKWSHIVDQIQEERVAELQRQAHDDYQKAKNDGTHEAFDRRARNTYRHELQDTE